jgi:glucosamine kinase
MAIPYFIGIDGGGTATRARVLDAAGRRVGEGKAGPSGLSHSGAHAWPTVEAAIADAFGGAVPPKADCALGIGIAGAHIAMQRQAFLNAAAPYAALAVESDSHTALLGSHAGAPGVALIAGTGSVGEALHADGRRALVGGWGFPAGDEGSGGWLGLRAMALAQRAFDGRERGGPLAQAVRQAIGGDEAALRAWSARAGQHRFAQLAPLVFAHEADDPAAAALLARAVDALAAHADALDGAGTLPISVLGSIGRRLAPRLPARLQERLREPQGDALDGALVLARRAAA